MANRFQSTVRRLTAVAAAAVFLLMLPDLSSAQLPNGFNKSGRSNRPASDQSQGTRSSNQNRGQSRGNQGRNRGKGYGNQNRGRNYNPAFNHHSFSPSRFGGGITRYSTTFVVPRTYGPILPYGHDIYPFGYGATVYPNVFGYGSGFGNYNPAYATYGSYLNTGGVLSSNIIGSSVAAQALQRSQNQQPILPQTQLANDPREIEILRLQIELEKAKQQLANQNQPAQQPPPKPPVDANPTAVDQLGLAPIIETSQLAAASHLKSEQAFRVGDYGKAARFAGLASSLDETNGKLLLFASQTHFANGEFNESAAALSKAIAMLPADEMGWVVENFKLFYGQNDFVTQMRRLSSHLKQSPNDASAWMLRGYQYGALGYPEAARTDLTKAKELGAAPETIESLLGRFAMELESK